MRGTILGVHDGKGVLLGADERRFEFPLTEWRSAGTPVAGQIVDFIDDAGQARAVFAAPGAYAPIAQPHSGSMVTSAIAVGCLLLGFIIPFLPTVAAYVLGVIGAGQARTEGDNTALILARIAWIGALVLLIVGLLVLVVVFGLIGTLGLASIHNGWNF